MRKISGFVRAGILSVVVAAAVLVPAVASADTAGGPEGTGSIPALTFLHVVTPTTGPDLTPYLADATGRQVLLRGVAAVGMEDVAYPNANGGPALFPVSPSAYQGRCPAASPLIPQPPLCEVQAASPAYQQSTAPGSGDDFAEMRALGFNVVRLVLNWSQLEPTPGAYSRPYLQRVAQVVGWARQQGIYVILDMHQDQYSRFIVPAATGTTPSCIPSGGGDGAPAWAVQADGQVACALLGINELNPAEAAAFHNFWQNSTVNAPQGQAPGTGLQDHYIGALAALAQRFENDPAVLGYELMNEPQPGAAGSVPVANGYQASSQELYPFYTRATEALTGVRDGRVTCPADAPTSLVSACAYPRLASVSRQQIFFEPLAYRNLVDFSLQVSAPFSSYPNLVFAPHVYTDAFTFEQDLLGLSAGQAGGYPPNFTFGYQTAEAEAQAMHAAVFTTEFGDSSSTDSTIVSNELAAQEATQTGGTLWAWKGLAQAPGSCWCVRWQFSSFQTTSNGTPGAGDPQSVPSPLDQLIPSRQQILMRVSPVATAGRLDAYHYDPATRTFAMIATATATNARADQGNQGDQGNQSDRGNQGADSGDRGTDTVLSIPSNVDGPVRASGAAVLDFVRTAPDGSRTAYVKPIPQSGSDADAGVYEVTVGTTPDAVLATVTSQAANPLPPIPEPAARTTALNALNALAHSTNPQVSSRAQLFQGLATIVFGSTDPNTAGS